MSEQPSSLHTPWTTAALDGNAALMRTRIESEQLRLLGSAVQVAASGIAILTPAVEEVGPRIAFVNEGFSTMYGRRRDEIIGHTLDAFGIVERQQPVVEAMLRHVFEHKPFMDEATAQRKDGSEFEIEVELVPVEDAGELTHWVAFLRDVSENKMQLVALQHQAMHDPLTDLPNRMMLFDRLDSPLAAAREAYALTAPLLVG